MVDNQHRKISGYRDLSEEEIALMNEIKGPGIELERIITRLRRTRGIDQRWVNIGQEDLQKGLMALVRAVAKPDSF